jgi:hypothetical protein
MDSSNDGARHTPRMCEDRAPETTDGGSDNDGVRRGSMGQQVEEQGDSCQVR